MFGHTDFLPFQPSFIFIMCFSASASFGASVVLSAIGVVTIRKANRPSHVLFAAIPFIFAMQQLSEGFLWVIIPYPTQHLLTQKVMTYSFLFFAQVFWPLWIPIAIIFLEKKEKLRKIQYAWVASGMVVAVYSLIGLINHIPHASIVGYHVAYDNDFHNTFRKYTGLFYIAATIMPSFFSHIKRIWIFGICILISYIITAIFYEQYVVSVWCFFSSIISIFIYIIIVHNNRLGYEQKN